MPFVSWTEIDLFHNVRRAMTFAQPAEGPSVAYRAKVKLHGTNAAIQMDADGAIACQSRSQLLTVTSDNAGFARWVESVKDAWSAALSPGQVLFGEWCGPGVMKGVAVNGIGRKIFAAFAMLETLHPEGPRLVVEPDELARIVLPEGAYVLPWHEGADVTVDWSASPEELTPVTARINAWVEAVEACDPWVKSTFGVEGTGEGLVFYPVGSFSPEGVYLRMFKAKGEAHRVLKTKVAAQVAPDVAASVDAFVALVLPEARLAQGADAVTPDGAGRRYETARIGAFLGWIARDVEKETRSELAASGLDPKRVAKAVSDRARAWYLAKIAAE